ncbi:hypothetical protein EDC04DRAFT_2893424 [Pisolithus marmoratus]|nr:hypothetical protein EDC04DRAFT_2893424 [Pisolithus marmoratus]
MDCVFPNDVEVKNGSVTLSNDKDFSVISYVRTEDNTCFLLFLGYCGGRYSAFVTLAPMDVRLTSDSEDWDDPQRELRSRAFERLFNSNHDPRYKSHHNAGYNTHLMQHTHFPQSIEGVRVVHRVPHESRARCTVTIDIPKCSGCCTHEERLTYYLVETPRIPGLMWNCLLGKVHQTGYLSENYEAIPLSLMESELQPGDYGRVPRAGDKFTPEGNIIRFAAGVGLDPIQDDITHHPERGGIESTLSLTRAHPEHSISSRLDLHGVTSWSLPANQQVVSLLHALSCRLSGRLLVTSVIRCSDPRRSPRLYSTRTRWGEFDMNAWQTVDTPTPLCSVMVPLTWCQVDLDRELMTMLLKIVDNFAVLVRWVDRLDDPKHLVESVTVETAIKFFVDIFGGNFRNFIGDIVFFCELPAIVEMANHTELDTRTDKGRYATQDIPGGREATVMVQTARIDALVAFLAEIDVNTFDLQVSPEFEIQVGSKHIGWTTLWKNGIGWRSAPFAKELIGFEYADDWFVRLHNQDTGFDRREFLSEVDQIKIWREMLITTNDEHERRTLVEDIVGKILLACWRGVKSEIVQVVNQYANNEAVGQKSKDRTHRQLLHLRSVFGEAMDYIPCECPHPLQRILDDAAHGVSKHQLLLAERAELASQSSEARHTLKRKRGTSDSAEPSSPVQVKR